MVDGASDSDSEKLIPFSKLKGIYRKQTYYEHKKRNGDDLSHRLVKGGVISDNKSSLTSFLYIVKVIEDGYKPENKK